MSCHAMLCHAGHAVRAGRERNRAEQSGVERKGREEKGGTGKRREGGYVLYLYTNIQYSRYSVLVRDRDRDRVVVEIRRVG